MTHDTVTRYWRENDDDSVVPCYDVVEWARWFSDHDPVVAATRLPSVDPDTADHAIVSTVFVGTQPDPLARPPRVYETVVFAGPTILARKLSCTREEALATHEDLVTRISSLQ